MNSVDDKMMNFHEFYPCDNDIQRFLEEKRIKKVKYYSLCKMNIFVDILISFKKSQKYGQNIHSEKLVYSRVF